MFRQVSNQFRSSRLVGCTVVVLVLLALSSLSGVSARLQYHQQGIQSKTGKPFYRFGFEANENIDNPLARYEMSSAPGYVKGRYSYRTADNQIRIIEYESTPNSGMKIRLLNELM